MSLKENVNAIKEELTTEEQFLESVIKAEGFWKKYKMPIIIVATVVIMGLLAKAIMGYIAEQNLISANEAYSKVVDNSTDKEALSTLKSKSPALYELYLFNQSMKKGEVAALEEVKTKLSDPILGDLLTYQIASLKEKMSPSDIDIAKELALFEEGFLLLKANKIKEAKAKFAQIPQNSSLKSVVENLNHYMGKE